MPFESDPDFSSDILGHFDVILSQRRNEICLLAPRHQYRIERA